MSSKNKFIWEAYQTKIMIIFSRNLKTQSLRNRKIEQPSPAVIETPMPGHWEVQRLVGMWRYIYLWSFKKIPKFIDSSIVPCKYECCKQKPIRLKTRCNGIPALRFVIQHTTEDASVYDIASRISEYEWSPNWHILMLQMLLKFLHRLVVFQTIPIPD